MKGAVHNKRYILVIMWCSLLYCPNIYGQQGVAKDSLNLRNVRFTKNKFINKIFQQAVGSVTRDGSGNIITRGKSEDPYLPYQGKIIRNIYVTTLNFDRSFTDTAHRDKGILTTIGKGLHRVTREFVVRNNLFVKEHTELNAYKVADNERYLRTLDFISDARIIVQPVRGSKDSVDLQVYTKDFFPISGGMASAGLNHVTTNLYDANIGGLGQRLELASLYDYNRHPYWGYGGLYRQNNVGGSFVDATVGYSVMNINSYTRTEESQTYVALSRRLLSPYSKIAGAISFSTNQAYNLYNAPDSLFYKYKYDFFDVWAGYNVAIGRLTATNNSIRDRRFFSMRYYKRNFYEVPWQIDKKFHFIYNTSEAVLGQITFFRQDYYKTQYVYGFGTTEDLPYGYNIAVVGGWHTQLGRERPYAGLNASRYLATSKGDFVELYMRSGGFLWNKGLQDGGFVVGAAVYSRLAFVGSTKIRQYINASFSYQHQTVTGPPLRLNTPYGLRGFLSDSVNGARRLSVQLETTFYLRWRLLGFQFAPFPYADFALIAPENWPTSRSSLYTSLGGGVRMRNENLVFETIEARAFFFPVAPSNMRAFKIIVSANLRYRYPSSLITAPDIVQLN
ncbi:MAG: hypothetical protein V4649_01500 [Bacteroidota bacterium]